MSARGRGNRGSKKHRSGSNSHKVKVQPVSLSASQEPEFIKPCDHLLNQITLFGDSKPFHQQLPTKDPLYKEYRKLNPNPICFKTVQKRLHQKPSSYYNGYKEFTKDVAQIFVQEKKLKYYKGVNKKEAEKRCTLARRVEKYWNTLIAPYEQYGFQTMIKSQREQGSRDSNDNNDQTEDEQKKIVESEQEETPRRPPAMGITESKQTRKTLSNIKKRAQRGEKTPVTTVDSKRRRLNDHEAVPVANTGDTTVSISHEDDAFHHASNCDEFSEIRDDEKVRHDEDDGVDLFQDNHNHNRHRMINEDNNDYRNEYEKQNGHMFADTVFSPFADKISVFNRNYNAHELFSGDCAVKKLLRFEGSKDFEQQHIADKTPEKSTSARTIHRFKIKYTYTGNGEMMYTVTAPQMDMAVRQFRETHKTCKILTAELLI